MTITTLLFFLFLFFYFFFLFLKISIGFFSYANFYFLVYLFCLTCLVTPNLRRRTMMSAQPMNDWWLDETVENLCVYAIFGPETCGWAGLVVETQFFPKRPEEEELWGISNNLKEFLNSSFYENHNFSFKHFLSCVNFMVSRVIFHFFLSVSF